MRSSPRLAFVLLLLLAGLLGPGAAATLATTRMHPPTNLMPKPTKLYVGHAGRLTLEIPGHWLPAEAGIYRGPDGAVWDAPVVGVGHKLDSACRQEVDTGFYGTEPDVEVTTLAGSDACIIRPSDDQPDLALGTMAAVLPHLYPFETLGERAEYVAIGIDPAHFDAIMATLNFDPRAITAEDYFTSVFDLIQAATMTRDALDWDRVRIQAEAQLGTSGTLADAYPALRYVVSRLSNAGDYTSFFMTPEEAKLAFDNELNGFGFMLDGDVIVIVFPGSPADRAGLRVGDTIERVDGKITWSARDVLYNPDPKEARFSIRRPGVAHLIEETIAPERFDTYLPPEGRRLEDAGYIELFGVFGDRAMMSRYATAAHDVIARIDRIPACGWVIDVRRNYGGSYVPIVAAVGAILGNGDLWGYQTADGETTLVTYDDGRVLADGIDFSGQVVEGSPYPLKKPMPPVAVLMGPLTMGSGEIALLSFAGRADTRFFGENSGGFTLAGYSFTLFDGAVVDLAVGVMIDRTGKTYPRGVVPDAYVPTDWASFGSDDDPVLQAAFAWLQEQPACSSTPYDPDQEPPRS